MLLFATDGTLQTTFYTLGIVFMGIILLIILAILIAVLVIRSKIVAIHDAIEDKLSAATDIQRKGKELASSITKTLKKTKKRGK